MDNTRKRIEREKSEGIAYANESIMRQLVEVVDNLERAIEHGERDENCEGLLDGVRMTHKSFIDVLARFGAAPFESVGCGFDPNRHEAVIQEQNPRLSGYDRDKGISKRLHFKGQASQTCKGRGVKKCKSDTC